jgi:hypothetical protein
MLKPYAVIDCESQKIITEKTLKFLQNSTNFFDSKDLELWNKINTKDLLMAVPEINVFYRSIGLKIKEIAFTVWNSQTDVGLHIDELPVIAKINFPILNTQDTYNEWYAVPDQLLQMVKPIVNHFGSSFYDLATVDLDQCTKIAEIELIKPVVFNSQLPHKIRIGSNAQFPRIVMTCMFFNQPLDWINQVDAPA